MNSASKWVVLLGSLSLSFIGCQSQKADDSSPVVNEHPRLWAAVANYQLPANSIRPTRNPNPNLDRVIEGIAVIAAEQGLTFDGSRAEEGIVIVGRPGQIEPILIALALYEKDGRVLMQDTASYNGLDVQDAQRIHKRFMAALWK